MAIMRKINCPECNCEIISSNRVCPHCGYMFEYYRPKRKARYLLATLSVLCALGFLLALKMKNDKKPGQNEKHMNNEAQQEEKGKFHRVYPGVYYYYKDEEHGEGMYVNSSSDTEIELLLFSFTVEGFQKKVDWASCRKSTLSMEYYEADGIPSTTVYYYDQVNGYYCYGFEVSYDIDWVEKVIIVDTMVSGRTPSLYSPRRNFYYHYDTNEQFNTEELRNFFINH